MSEPEGIIGEYSALKDDADADLLAMQVGDFYEFFDEDARIVGRELDLKISQKSSGGTTVPMAGVPVADLDPYLSALVERGYRVGVADQFETEDGHARELSRIVTPGTLIEATDHEARHLVAITGDGDRYGLAVAEVTTGQFHVMTADNADELLTECYRFDPVELLPGPELKDGQLLDRIIDTTAATVTEHQENAFAPGAARHQLETQFGKEAIDAIGLTEPTIRAAGAVLEYLEATNEGVRAAITRLQPARSTDHVRLDATTQRNLELIEPMSEGGQSLLETLDKTITSAGHRQLAAWLTRPTRDRDRLDDRLGSVEALAEAALARAAIRDTLESASDLERLATRVINASVGPRDMLRIRDTLETLPDLIEQVSTTPTLASSPLASYIGGIDREQAASLATELREAIVDDPPASFTEGGVFKPGYSEDLNELIDQHEEALNWIQELEEREKQAHDITHLQVDRNRTDGYYIQVGRSEADDVPDRYQEIKALKNSKRFTTDALEQREREILRLEEQRNALEEALFRDLRDEVATHAELLHSVGHMLATIDLLAGLAVHAVENGWHKPTLGADGITIEAGRHPVVEQTEEFVPNDARMGAERRFAIVTGPNMSGKSTYMRQIALIVLLAQIGSFVPADRVEIELVDGIFTRVGALDELAQGRSTFMVEMEELSNILHAATEDSLVVLDEVGRGTATYDGISIAWAATEYIASQIRSITLFATHYHELTQLGDHLDDVYNIHIAAEERDGDVTFLRTVSEGPTDRSYGIHVAQLAGVPSPVVDRARDILGKLRDDKAIDIRDGRTEPRQVVFDLGAGEYQDPTSADGGSQEAVDPTHQSILEELAEMEIQDQAPIDLMARVQEWQDRLNSH